MKKYHNPSLEKVSIDTKDIMQTSVMGDGAVSYINEWDGKLGGMGGDWTVDM